MEASHARLLVVDDEIALRGMLELALTHAGFEVRAIADGREALEAISSYAPDLIVLDVMLPGIDGISLLPSIRRLTEVPVVILSAKTDLDEKITGLARGADDYVAKPFELAELIARIRSNLRRPRLEDRETLRYADLTVDVSRRVVLREGRTVDLSPREFDLLATLARRPEQVFTRVQLLDLVWGFNSDVYPNTLETYISYLRAKIDSGKRVKLIRTLRGVGYALHAQAR